MIPSTLFQRWPSHVALAISLTAMLVGCSTVPRHYVRMAEPGVTLTELIAHPDNYRGKVVLLGGTIVDEEESGPYLWLYVKNRPLDQDYIPHRPADEDGPEAGYYWVMIPTKQIPHSYRQWGRMTVVGQVTGTQRTATEPVLSLLYVRGWGTNQAHHSVWEKSTDPNYVPSTPAGLGGEYKGALP